MAGKPDGEVKAMDVAFNALSGLKPDEKRRVLTWLWEKLEVGGVSPAGAAAGAVNPSNVAPPAPPGNLAAKSFLAQKDPKTDGERITCLVEFDYLVIVAPRQELATSRVVVGKSFSDLGEAPQHRLGLTRQFECLSIRFIFKVFFAPQQPISSVPVRLTHQP
jgi:hypothetical protein